MTQCNIDVKRHGKAELTCAQAHKVSPAHVLAQWSILAAHAAAKGLFIVVVAKVPALEFLTKNGVVATAVLGSKDEV